MNIIDCYQSLPKAQSLLFKFKYNNRILKVKKNFNIKRDIVKEILHCYVYLHICVQVYAYAQLNIHILIVSI